MSVPRRLDQFPAYAGTDPTGIIYYLLDGVAYQVPFSQLLGPWNDTIFNFLPRSYNYETDDASEGLVDAWEWSITNGPVLIPGYLRLEEYPVLSGAGNFLFLNPRINVLDTGSTVAMFSGTSAKAGLMVTNAAGAVMRGNASIIGTGTVAGTTRLVGSIFYDSDGIRMDAQFHVENCGEGRIIAYCDNAQFAGMTANNLYGTQPFTGTGTAGSIDVIYGCVGTTVGPATGKDVFKAARYFSVGTNAAGNKVTNENLIVGTTNVRGRDSSAESSLIAARALKNSFIAGATGSNVATGLFLTRYDGDNDYELDGNTFDGVIADVVNSSASADAVFQSVLNNSGTPPEIGRNHIKTIRGSAPLSGQCFGVLADSGDLKIDTCEVAAANPVQIAGINADFGHFRISGQVDYAFRYDTCTGRVEKVEIVTGPSAANTYHGVFNSGSVASPGFSFGTISFAQNGVGNTVVRIFADTHSTPAQVPVDTITGSATSGPAFWSGSFTPTQVFQGRWVSTVAMLPAAAAAYLDKRAQVTDANATTFASTVAAGGSNKVPVYCDGTAWKIG